MVFFSLSLSLPLSFFFISLKKKYSARFNLTFSNGNHLWLNDKKTEKLYMDKRIWADQSINRFEIFVMEGWNSSLSVFFSCYVCCCCVCSKPDARDLTLSCFACTDEKIEKIRKKWRTSFIHFLLMIADSVVAFLLAVSLSLIFDFRANCSSD